MEQAYTKAVRPPLSLGQLPHTFFAESTISMPHMMRSSTRMAAGILTSQSPVPSVLIEHRSGSGAYATAGREVRDGTTSLSSILFVERDESFIVVHLLVQRDFE